MNRSKLIALSLALGCSLTVAAQTPTAGNTPAPIPAPTPSTEAIHTLPPSEPLVVGGPDAVRLSVADAERLALKNNPRIAVARLLALAQHQVTRETRAAELPSVTGNLTAVDSHTGSRVTAGALNNPVIYSRAAGGVTVSQLITDFGRTRNLVGSAKLQERAQASASEATTAEITLAVDEAYYRALGAQNVVDVANETVKERQTTVDQISALTNAKLRSTLDLSFSNVALAQAKLMVLNATNDLQDAISALNALLGEEGPPKFVLVEDTPASPPLPPQDPDALVEVAFNNRPDLRSLNQQAQAAKKFSAAEHDLNRPTISALGDAGGAPIRSDHITSSWDAAAGVNVNIPIFEGFLFSARGKEASLRAHAAQQQVKELRDIIARDVRTTALQAESNYERIAVAQQLLDEANSALDLAQTRYSLGLSSIVELSQAQLAQTQALIDLSGARYVYAGSLANIRFQTGQ